LAGVDVRVVDDPAQNALLPLIDGVAGKGFTVTINGNDVAVQPLTSVTVTLYAPAADARIVCAEAPVLHELPVGALEVSVVLLPAQIALLPAITGVAGSELTTIFFATDVAEHPLGSVTVTDTGPAVETVMDCVVCPLLQA
jgi:hypothetical protein